MILTALLSQHRSGCLFGVSLLAMATAGCDDTADGPQVERVSVEGRITLDGQPLEAGAIVFRGPLNATEGPLVTAYAFVEAGRYQIDAASGPAVGTSRVEVIPKPLPREELEGSLDEFGKSRSRLVPTLTVVEIPEKYGQNSELRAELLRDRLNQHNFQLNSRS